jgi:nitrate reductase beta subunit
MSAADLEDMYRLLAIGDYGDRYVVPKAHAEIATTPFEEQGSCGLDFAGGPGPCATGAEETTAVAAGANLLEMLDRKGGS